MKKTVECLKKLGPECIHACHCPDLSSKIELAKTLILKDVGGGMKLEYE